MSEAIDLVLDDEHQDMSTPELPSLHGALSRELPFGFYLDHMDHISIEELILHYNEIRILASLNPAFIGQEQNSDVVRVGEALYVHLLAKKKSVRPLRDPMPRVVDLGQVDTKVLLDEYRMLALIAGTDPVFILQNRDANSMPLERIMALMHTELTTARKLKGLPEPRQILARALELVRAVPMMGQPAEPAQPA